MGLFAYHGFTLRRVFHYIIVISTQQCVHWWFIIFLSILACMTTEGKQCLFPFKYRNKTDDTSGHDDAEWTELEYTKCSTLDIYRPWCPTSKNECSE